MPDDSTISASEIQTIIQNLETAHHRVTDLLEQFAKQPEKTGLAREIYHNVDQTLAKLRFSFTTLETAGETLRTGLECAWGECPRP
jgi:hypothetical protein